MPTFSIIQPALYSLELSELATAFTLIEEAQFTGRGGARGPMMATAATVPDLRAEPNEDHDDHLRMWGCTVVFSGASGLLPFFCHV